MNDSIDKILTKLVGALEECSDDLEAEIMARADCELPRRITRDLEPVENARKLIGSIRRAGLA